MAQFQLTLCIKRQYSHLLLRRKAGLPEHCCSGPMRLTLHNLHGQTDLRKHSWCDCQFVFTRQTESRNTFLSHLKWSSYCSTLSVIWGAMGSCHLCGSTKCLCPISLSMEQIGPAKHFCHNGGAPVKLQLRQLKQTDLNGPLLLLL